MVSCIVAFARVLRFLSGFGHLSYQPGLFERDQGRSSPVSALGVLALNP